MRFLITHASRDPFGMTIYFFGERDFGGENAMNSLLRNPSYNLIKTCHSER
jgi:hypothetical protein